MSSKSSNRERTGILPEQEAPDQDLFRKGEELITNKQDHEIILYKKVNSHLGYVSLHEIMLSEMFLEAMQIDEFCLRFFVEDERIETSMHSRWIPIRIEVYIKESVFDDEYKRLLESNEAKIIELK